MVGVVWAMGYLADGTQENTGGREGRVESR